MKQYPQIPHWGSSPIGLPCIAFDKLDGSNIRFEYSSKRGWYKYGTRRQMLGRDNEDFGQAIPLFEETVQEQLTKILKSQKDFRGIKKFLAYCEYLGENSSAGFHEPADDMKVVLIDVWVDRKGFISPRDFVRMFGDKIEIPEIVYEGNFNKEFIERVYRNDFNLKEGVVAKGTRQGPPGRNVWMAKAKTEEWLLRVKGKLGDERYQEEIGN